jgi:DNA-binding transcriptional LysR family regulator
MAEEDLTALSAFVVVAEERSFTRAAKRLGVSPSAMSHAMRGLEERVGVRLLSRTTRSVAPTDAGQELLAQLRPALSEVHVALDRVAGLRKKPAGRVRLLVPRFAAGAVLAPKLGEFANILMWYLTSPQMTVVWTSLPRDSTRASTSASTLKRT